MDPDLFPSAPRRRERKPAAVGGPSLFDQPQPALQRAPHNKSDGSRTAAARVDRQPSKAERDRETIVHVLLAVGERGLTRPELSSYTGLSQNSVNPRVWELLQESPPRIAERGSRDNCAVLIHHSYVRPFGAREVDRG